MHLTTSGGLICCLLFAATTATAAPDRLPEETDDSDVPVPELVLGRHFFQPPVLQLSPFITTDAGVRQGIQDLQIKNAPVRAGRTIDMEALGISDDVLVGFALWKRLQITLGGSATAYSGNAFTSIIVGGAGYSYKGNVGLGFRIFRASTTELTVRGSLEGGRGDKVELLTLASALVNQPLASIDQIISNGIGPLIVSKTSRTAETLSFHLAQSFGPAVGLQAAAGLSHAHFDVDLFDRATVQQIDTGVHLWTPEFSLAVSFDLRPLVPAVPVAVMAEYSLTATHGDSTAGENAWLRANQLFGFGVYYSGRKNLALGVSAYRAFDVGATHGFDWNGRTFPTGDPKYNTALLTVRYTW